MAKKASLTSKIMVQAKLTFAELRLKLAKLLNREKTEKKIAKLAREKDVIDKKYALEKAEKQKLKAEKKEARKLSREEMLAAREEFGEEVKKNTLLSVLATKISSLKQKAQGLFVKLTKKDIKASVAERDAVEENLDTLEEQAGIKSSRRSKRARRRGNRFESLNDIYPNSDMPEDISDIL